MAIKKIIEDARETEVRGEYDVLVMGGGPAGIAASIAASRSGARTLLVERYGFLGGMATAGMVGSFCGFFTTGPQKKRIVGGIASLLLGRLKDRDGVSERSTSKVDPRIASLRYNPEVLKVVAEEAAAEGGVELLFHTFMVEVVWEIKGSRLSGVIVENKSGRSAFLGKVIIDATGDGDVAFRAHVPYEVGDEKGRSQAMTTMFRVINVDLDALRLMQFQDIHKKLEEARQTEKFGFRRVDGVITPALPSGIVSANISSIPDLNGADATDLTRAEIEGRRQVWEYLRAFRNVLPGFEHAEISSIAPQVGIRETRRIQGEYLLREEEVLEGKKFGDAIALGAWPVEIHDPETRRIQWKFLEKEDDYYTIPLRCLIPRHIDNLLIAGRCISATHVAQASTRVIAQALAMGEAAGIIASQSVDSKTIPREISPGDIQEELKRHSAILEV
jgi:hypothetical protein